MRHPSLVVTPAQLGPVLRARRRDCGLTQVQAASNVGLLPKTVSALELDPTTSTVASLFKLLSALDLEVILRPRGTDEPDRTDW